MSKWSTALVVVSLLLGPRESSGVPAALPGKPAPARTGDSRKTRQVSAADAFYKQGAVQVVHLQVSEADLARLKAALPKRIYVPGTFRWGEQVLENVGVRYKGNSSSNPRQKHKRSFLVKFGRFQPGRTFLGLQRVALDNGIQFGSVFSEPLVTRVLHDVGVTAARCNHAKLFLNGKYHGVYVNVERIDSVFLKTRFTDGGGPLYKVDEGGPGGNLAPFALPPDQANRHAFEPKSSVARADARDMLELITRINKTPPDRFAEMLQGTIVVDDFLKTMAVMLFAGAFDQLTGWNAHNYYLYREPADTSWHYLPWDLDVGFADKAFRRIPVIAGWNAAWPVAGGRPQPLIERIVDNPKLLKRYRRMADGILEKHFHPRILLPRIDAMYGRISQDLEMDPFPHRRVTNPEDRNYDTVVASIKEFVRVRYKTARMQLDKPGDRPKIVRNRPPRPGKPSKDAPTGLVVLSMTASTVTLRWKDNADGEAGHIVQRADGEPGKPFRNLIGRPGRNSMMATDNSVVAGRTYRYRVYGVHPTPDGPRGTGVSNVVTVRVPKK
ncbi:MAG: CotH kinase family protein [Planctomycetota bacterium]|nr:CotH kinase family protein [Planctomycetota bacterium]